MKRSMSESEAGPFRLAASPSHLLHRAQQRAADYFTTLVGDVVTLRQYVVLAAIAEAPGSSQNDLVRATGVDRSTLTEMLTRMQKRGWLTRTPSAADKRVHTIRLTAAGNLILTGATPAAKAADAAMLALLTRPKARTLLGLLSKLDKNAEDANEKAEKQARRQAKRDAKRKKDKPKPRRG